MSKKKPAPRRKRLIITDHAAARMNQRNVSHNQLVVTIRSPDRKLPAHTTYTSKVEKDFPQGRTLVAVIEERATVIRAITAYWK